MKDKVEQCNEICGPENAVQIELEIAGMEFAGLENAGQKMKDPGERNHKQLN